MKLGKIQIQIPNLKYENNMKYKFPYKELQIKV